MADQSEEKPKLAHYPRQTSKKTVRELRMLERQDLALELHTAGSSLSQISTHLESKGYKGSSRSNVGNDIKAALERAHKESGLKNKHHVQLELKRLDKLTLALWTRTINNGKPKDVQAMLRIMDRRARLLGLDKPQKFDISARDALAKLLGKDPEELPDGTSDA